MPINKVVYGSNVLIDISDTTAVASDVTAGKYFYALDGTKTLGTASGGGGDPNEYMDMNLAGTLTTYKTSVTHVRSNAFRSSSVTTLVLTALESMVNNGYCLGYSNLETVDISGSYSRIGTGTFSSSGSFNVLILRKSTMVSLGSTNAFNATPFASGKTGGTLYVPSALISSYQSATNWSTILGYANNQILPIEGSIYETEYADGTPVE